MNVNPLLSIFKPMMKKLYACSDISEFELLILSLICGPTTSIRDLELYTRKLKMQLALCLEIPQF